MANSCHEGKTMSQQTNSDTIKTHVKWARHYNRKAVAEIFHDARSLAVSLRRYHMSKARVLHSVSSSDQGAKR